jgi:hypothetical protein
MAERRAALGVRPVRAGTKRDICHDHTPRCASKNASSSECLGLRNARDALLFDAVANFDWRDRVDLSCEHDATAWLLPHVVMCRRNCCGASHGTSAFSFVLRSNNGWSRRSLPPKCRRSKAQKIRLNGRQRIADLSASKSEMPRSS